MTSHPEDETYMRRCLALAGEALTHGDAPVGAIIVREREIAAEASEQVVLLGDVTAHAELLAIQEACRTLRTRDLSECVLYTNVEPCWMCAYAIRETGISKVVIGVPIEGIGGATSRYPLLIDATIPGWTAPPVIAWGVLADECAALRR